jgi:hypothetical protein
MADLVERRHDADADAHGGRTDVSAWRLETDETACDRHDVVELAVVGDTIAIGVGEVGGTNDVALLGMRQTRPEPDERAPDDRQVVELTRSIAIDVGALAGIPSAIRLENAESAVVGLVGVGSKRTVVIGVGNAVGVEVLGECRGRCESDDEKSDAEPRG